MKEEEKSESKTFKNNTLIYIFQTKYVVRSNNLSLKYQKINSFLSFEKKCLTLGIS